MPQRLLFRKSALIPHLPSRHTVRIPRLANSLARSFMVALRLSFNGRKMIIRRNMKQQTELSWIAPWSKTHTGPSGNALVHSLASSSPNWITHHIWFLSLYTLAFPGVSKPKHLFKCMNILSFGISFHIDVWYIYIYPLIYDLCSDRWYIIWRVLWYMIYPEHKMKEWKHASHFTCGKPQQLQPKKSWMALAKTNGTMSLPPSVQLGRNIRLGYHPIQRNPRGVSEGHDPRRNSKVELSTLKPNDRLLTSACIVYIYIICMYICVCPQVCMYISMCIYIYIIKYHTYTAHALTLILQRIATICAIPAAPACMQTTAMRCGFLWGQEGWFAAKGCVHTTLASTLRGWDPTAKRRKRRLLLLIPGRPGSYRTLCFRHFLTLRTPCWQFF